MTNELRRRPPWPLALSAALILLAGCAAPLPDPEPDPAPDAAAAPRATQGAEAVPGADAAQRKLQRALHALQQRPPNLARARNQLDSLLATRDEDARPLHPYARVLIDQINERQRLGLQNERLAQQLERHALELKESQLRNDELQRKLDALAEIERSLSPRSGPAPGPASAPGSEAR